MILFRDMKLDEQTWRRAERDMLRRERIRLQKKGWIRHSSGIARPTVLVKTEDGTWIPRIKVFNVN